MSESFERPDSDERAAVIEEAGARRGISIDESAREAMHAHAAGTTSVEIGGVLVGEVDEETGDVLVVAAIPAHRATSAVASLTFTHEAWDEVNDVMSRDFEGKQMVGWYHSHPRFGIFLSEYDVFIQKNFFREEWQVAYVVDPVSQTSGVFGWEKGEIVRYSSWNVVARGAPKAVREPDRGSPTRTTGGSVPVAASEPVSVHLDDGQQPAGSRHKGIIAGGLAIFVAGMIAVGAWLAFGTGTSTRPAKSASVGSRRSTTATKAHPASPSDVPRATDSPSGTVTVLGVNAGPTVLAEHWALHPIAGLGYLDTVTITLSPAATETLAGTVEQCAPPSVVPVYVGAQTSGGSCDLSVDGKPLEQGQSVHFLFLLNAEPADLKGSVTPTYRYPSTPNGTAPYQVGTLPELGGAPHSSPSM